MTARAARARGRERREPRVDLGAELGLELGERGRVDRVGLDELVSAQALVVAPLQALEARGRREPPALQRLERGRARDDLRARA